MPIHRSITRISRRGSNKRALDFCCCIIVFYIVLSIILTSNKVDMGYIIIINFITFGSSFVCLIVGCRNYSYADNLEDNNIPTIIAYPINNNQADLTDMEPVVCVQVD
tara:strand:+ start:2984 stop:3307 length:324 start_codon:yes stop_codon:yes gene_type:complete